MPQLSTIMQDILETDNSHSHETTSEKEDVFKPKTKEDKTAEIDRTNKEALDRLASDKSEI